MEYRYIGDRLARAGQYCQRLCKAIRKNDKCIRGRNGNMLVQFQNGDRVVLPARQLRKIKNMILANHKDLKLLITFFFVSQEAFIEAFKRSWGTINASELSRQLSGKRKLSKGWLSAYNLFFYEKAHSDIIFLTKIVQRFKGVVLIGRYNDTVMVTPLGEGSAKVLEALAARYPGYQIDARPNLDELVVKDMPSFIVDFKLYDPAKNYSLLLPKVSN